jgi:tetratricopeptide (TPR) repeat protein
MACLILIPAHAQGKKSRASSNNSTTRAGGFDALAKRASGAREANRIDEAIPLYLQALKIKPAWKEGWWHVGSMFYDGDRYREARDAFRNLVALDQKFGPAWSMMGLCQFQLKEYEAALDSLRRGNGLGLGGNEDLALVARYHEAILLNRFEQFELAYEALIRTTKSDTPAPDLVLAMGLTMLRLPFLPAEAPPDKRELIFKTGHAAYLAVTNHVSDAVQEYKDLIAAYPNTPGVHYAYGVFLLRDSSDAAIGEFRRELELSPQHVAARLQLAFEYLKRKEYAAGLPYAEEAVRLAPNLFAAHNALGRILVETDEVERAIKELEIGVRLAPDSPEMLFALARAYARAGRTQDAARARAEFLKLEELRRAQREGTVSDPAPAQKPPNQRRKG